MHKPVVWPLHKPSSEPPRLADANPDVPPSLGSRPPLRMTEPLLKRAVAAADSSAGPPSLESIIAAVSADQPSNDRGSVWWKRPKVLVSALAVLAVVAPITVGTAVVVLSRDPPPMAAPSSRPPEPAAAVQASSAASAIPPRAATAVDPRASRSIVQAEKRPTPAPVPSNEKEPEPPQSALRNSPLGADDRMAKVEPENLSTVPQIAPLQPRHEATVPQLAVPASVPPAVTATFSALDAPTVSAASPAAADDAWLKSSRGG